MPADAARWLWLEGDPERLNRPRVYEDPARGRLLYRVGDRGLEYSGYRYLVCPGCGTLHARCDDRGQRLKECMLCRTSLTGLRV